MEKRGCLCQVGGVGAARKTPLRMVTNEHPPCRWIIGHALLKFPADFPSVSSSLSFQVIDSQQKTFNTCLIVSRSLVMWVQTLQNCNLVISRKAIYPHPFAETTRSNSSNNPLNRFSLPTHQGATHKLNVCVFSSCRTSLRPFCRLTKAPNSIEPSCFLKPTHADSAANSADTSKRHTQLNTRVFASRHATLYLVPWGWRRETASVPCACAGRCKHATPEYPLATALSSRSPLAPPSSGDTEIEKVENQR